jgi:hypothetical protein
MARYSYDEYDEQDLRQEFGRGRGGYRCSGPDYCGALDCERCYPGGYCEDEDEENEDSEEDEDTGEKSKD